jgi:phage tail sheath protein FI
VTVTADLDRAIKAGAFWGWELMDTSGTGNDTTTIDSPSLTFDYER